MDDDMYHYDSSGNLTGFSSKKPPERPIDYSVVIFLFIVAAILAWNYEYIIDYIKRYDEHSFPINIVCFNLYWVIKPPLVFLYESYSFIINATKFENLNFLLWLTTIVLFFGFILKVCFFMNEVIQEKTNYNLNLIHVILLPTSISIVIYLLYIAFLVVKWFFAWIFAV